MQGPAAPPIKESDRGFLQGWSRQFDAPCSGVGTLRRRPEILLRKTKEDVARLSALQRRILASALTTAKPGATIVYATCSVLREEMEDVITGLPGATVQRVDRLLPQRDGTDGYAYATLVRTS